MFSLSDTPLNPEKLESQMRASEAGALVSFQGWVRDHNDGRDVIRLEYEAYQDLALKEGHRILEDALEKFDLIGVQCVHRVGSLEIGDIAVWLGVTSAHRDAAFSACRFIIDEIKKRVPIWKKEHYQNGNTGWINCETNQKN